MSEESTLEKIESKIDSHIEQQNQDYRKLMWWALTFVLGLIGTMSTWFITYGSLQQTVTTLKDDQRDLVTREEYQGLMNLLDERFRNLNEKLDKIITATR